MANTKSKWTTVRTNDDKANWVDAMCEFCGICGRCCVCGVDQGGGLVDPRERFAADCWRLVKGDLLGASSGEWADHIEWCFAAGWTAAACVGYWNRGARRGGADHYEIDLPAGAI